MLERSMMNFLMLSDHDPAHLAELKACLETIKLEAREPVQRTSSFGTTLEWPGRAQLTVLHWPELMVNATVQDNSVRTHYMEERERLGLEWVFVFEDSANVCHFPVRNADELAHVLREMRYLASLLA